MSLAQKRMKIILNNAAEILGTQVYESDLELAKQMLMHGTFEIEKGSECEMAVAKILAAKGNNFVRVGTGNFADWQTANFLHDTAAALLVA